jgi:menaquinone-specific isochorismate synthase
VIPAAATGVSAVRVGLEPDAGFDPFALAGSLHGEEARFLRSDRLTLVGIGCAAVLPLPDGLDDPAALDRAVGQLASIACDDRLAPADRDGLPAPVLAFGALPFDRGDTAALVVPELTFGATDEGRVCCTVVGTDGAALPRSARELTELLSTVAASGPTQAPDRNEVAALRPRTSDDDFESMVAAAVAAIDRGELAKVVLARQLDVTMTTPVDVAALLRRWDRLEPACTLFSVPVAEGRFVGASPELLVERVGGRVRCRPLAGTTGRRPTDDADDDDADDDAAGLDASLFDSQKDVGEHRLVVEAITGALAPFSHDLDTPSRPELVRLRSMAHLGTEIAGTLDARSDGSLPHVLELLAALHPTPAVGGVPAVAAKAMIDRLEPQRRGPYAGPVGFADAAGDGRFVVGIRSMTLRGADARLAAGVGVVDGSQPRSEREEADLKLRAVLGALVPEGGLGDLDADTRAGRPLARR